MSMTQLKKTDYIPFIDVGTADTASWKRIDYSTIFSLNPNPQTKSMDYICYETPVEEIEKYQPELPQEIALYEGNDIYDFVFEKFYNLPVGSEAKVSLLLCFGGSDKKAWQISETTLVLGELNTVDGKLSFTLKMGGDIERGTYTITTGAPTFTAATSES